MEKALALRVGPAGRPLCAAAVVRRGGGLVARRVCDDKEEDAEVLAAAAAELERAGGRSAGAAARAAAPHWPRAVLDALAPFGAAGGAVVAADEGHFVELLTATALPVPVVLRAQPGAATPRWSPDASAREAVRGVGAREALERLAAAAPDASARCTGEVEGRGRVELASGRGARGAARAASRARVEATFVDGPLGLGLAPLDYDTGAGAEVVDVDGDSQAHRCGIRPGFTLERVAGHDVRGWDFADIDALFDGPRPMDVVLAAGLPADRLYAVEMPAAAALGALGGGLAREPGEGLEEACPAVLWREDPSTLFVGDAGSATVVHHDIVGQVELCHVLSGTKLLGVAPWGEASERLLEMGVDEFDEGIGVPVHRPLTTEEEAILELPGLSLVAALPGDVVAFSSAAAHFATNGADGPCAAVFHGVMTPAAVHTLAAHPERLSPFDEDELEGDFAKHLTGRDLIVDGLLADEAAVRSRAERESWVGDARGPDAERQLRARLDDALRAASSAAAAVEAEVPVPDWPAWREADVFL